MTTILTAPARAALMLMDADNRIHKATDIFPNDVDSFLRPFWYVGVDDGEYPPTAAGVETPLERYRMELISVQFGAGIDNEFYEKETREIVANTLTYFAARHQLEYSNLNAYEAEPLAALSGVKWARVTSRTPVGVATRAGVEGEFWGASLVLSVQSEFVYEQVIVART